MAEAIGLGASIIGIAGAGVSTVTALTKFSISYRGSDKKIDELAARVSLTVTILRKEEFLATWNQALKACQENYAKLNAAIDKAKGVKKPGSGVSKGSKIPQLSTWFKLKWALGGDESFKELESSLEKACQQVTMMQQIVQLTAISVMAKRREPTDQEVAESRELMDKMNWILDGLSKSGILITQSEPSEVFASAGSDSTFRPVVGEAVGNFNTSSRGFWAKPGAGISTPSREARLSQRSVPAEPSAQVKNTCAPGPSSNKRRQLNGIDYILEAYYIVPRSVARNSPRGTVDIQSIAKNDYMLVAVDTKSGEPNVEHVIARLAHDVSARGDNLDLILPVMAKDSSVMEISWLIEARQQSSEKEDHWDLIEVAELSSVQAEQASTTILNGAHQAYLVVFRQWVGGAGPVLKIQQELVEGNGSLIDTFSGRTIAKELLERALETEMAEIDRAVEEEMLTIEHRRKEFEDQRTELILQVERHKDMLESSYASKADIESEHLQQMTENLQTLLDQQRSTNASGALSRLGEELFKARSWAFLITDGAIRQVKAELIRLKESLKQARERLLRPDQQQALVDLHGSKANEVEHTDDVEGHEKMYRQPGAAGNERRVNDFMASFSTLYD